MKNIKILAVVLFACISMWATAAVTAKMNIKVQGTLYDEILIVEDDATAADFSDPNNAPKQMNTANSWCLNIYAMNGTTKMGAVAIPDVEGLKLQFKSSVKEGNYTLSFSEVSGTEYFLQKGEDTDPNNFISMDEDYIFSCTPGDVVEFTIVKQAAPVGNIYTRDVVADAWGTICLPWASTALEGADFFEVLGTKDAELGVALAEVEGQLTAGMPYVFRATSNQVKVTYNPATEVEDEEDGNNITGSFEGCNVPAGMYIIYNNLLCKTADASSTIGEYRAYFDVESMGEYSPSQAPGRKVVFMGGRGMTTDFNSVKAAEMKNGKFIMNGRFMMKKDGKMYNAQGFQF